MAAESDILTKKQIAFCREYILDWNATKAAIRAGYSAKTAKEIGCQNLTKLNIKNCIEELQKNIQEIAGVSQLMILQEHMKVAFSSISNLHDTWIKRKDFESLTPEQKACISEISTQIRQYPSRGEDSTPFEVEYVKVKMYDKQKALDSISKMLGYDAPKKVDLSNTDGSLNQQLPPINLILTTNEKINLPNDSDSHG